MKRNLKKELKNMEDKTDYWINKSSEYQKKYINWLGFGIAVIVVLIVMVILGLSSYFPSNQPKFTITQEICHNETIYLPQKCFYDNNTPYVQVKECMDNEPDFIQAKKEVCEQKEVDEINQEILVWVANPCVNGYLDGKVFDSLGNEEPHCKEIENKTYEIHNVNILRKDLTETWLSENCQIAHCLNEDKLDFCDEDAKIISWKCGEFEVIR